MPYAYQQSTQVMLPGDSDSPSQFNAAAKAISRPSLEWSEVSTYGSLAELLSSDVVRNP